MSLGIECLPFSFLDSSIPQFLNSLIPQFSIISHQWQFSFNSAYKIWLVAVISLIAVFAVYFSWRGLGNVKSFGKRILLFSLRVVAIAIVTLMVFQPQIELQKYDELKNKLVLIFDSSESMTLSGSNSKQQRDEEIVRFFNENRSYVDQLEKEYDLDFLTFSDTTNESSRKDIEDGWNCSGDLTDIGRMLRYLRDNYDGGRTEAFLLFSDGGENASRWASVSNQLKMFDGLAGSLPAPLFSFGFESPDKIKDIAVTDVRHNEVAFVRNATGISATIKVSGFDGINVPVTVKEDENIISSKLIGVVPGKNEYTVDFDITPYELGSFVYSISTPVYENELVRTNNNKEFSLSVVRDKIRVLHICGRPSWDVRFFRHVLKQTPNIDLISFYILKTADDVSDVPTSEMSLIPFPIRELFTEMLDSFDMVIFQNFDYRPFDIPRNAFNVYFNNLRKYVIEAGGGFLMIGGDISFSRGGYDGTPIEDILPVEFDAGNGVDTGSFNAVPGRDGERHPLGVFEYNNSNNIAIWGSLPALYGCNEVSRVKPNATTIAAHPRLKVGDENMPIISVMNVEKGRSMAVMTDSLWRWGFLSVSKMGTNKPFVRFWNNAIKWLTHDPELNPVRVNSDKTDYSIGDTVKIEASVFDSSYKPIDGARTEINVKSISSGKDVFSVSKETDNDGRCYFGFEPEDGGYYKVMIKSRKEGVLTGENYSIFSVRQKSDEFKNVGLRKDLLTTISEASSGIYVKLQPDDKLKDKLSLKNKKKIVPVGKRDYSVWDNWIIFAFVVSVLSAEWWLRVKTGLS